MSALSARAVAGFVLKGQLPGLTLHPFAPDQERAGELHPLELMAEDLWWAQAQAETSGTPKE